MDNLMRSELKDTYKVLKLQNCILSIAKYLNDLCESHSVSYCLMGGSALGAVRHKGFIPWDDDLDVFMRPDDYERFREAFREYGDKEKYYLQEWGACDGMVTLAKLRLNTSTLIEKDLENWDIHQGVYVDIFILHTCPDNKAKRLNQYVWAKYLVTKGAANRGYKRGGGIGLLVSLCRLFPKRFLLKYALTQVYKYRDENSEFLCHFMGRALLKTGLYKRSYFEYTKKVPFETVFLSVPKEVESYLSDRWGDYMKIPPFEETLKYHHSWKWSDTEFFPGYKESGDYKDEKNLLA